MPGAMGEPQPQPTASDDAVMDSPPSTLEPSPSARESPEAAAAISARGRARTGQPKRPRTHSEAPSKRPRTGSEAPSKRSNHDSEVSSKPPRTDSEAPPAKRRRSDPDDSGSSSKRRRSDPDEYDPPTATAAPNKPNRAADAAADGLGSSPYGTRSRNRGGQSRPNYAEDDVDFEQPPAKRTSNAARAMQETDMEKAPAGGGRRAAAARAAEATAASSATASPAPSQAPPVNGDRMSGSPPPAPPRKRKAPANASNAAPGASRKSTQGGGSSAQMQRELGILSFERSKGCLQNGALITDDKIEFRANDYVYLVCEPPGEPYYIARIMEFIHRNNDPQGQVDYIRVNWLYRPRDIGRKATDSRLLFASMHADQSPVLSLRGKCHVQHRQRITDIDAYRKEKDSFYFSQMYERYMHRYYEVVPREKITNIAAKLKKIINEQWDFIISESSKVKELTSASKTCKVCGDYCPNNESVDCAVCKHTYHMTCIDPPLTKKPARGFAWSCGPCSRRQERKLEARNTPIVGENGENDDEDAPDEEEQRRRAIARRTQANSPAGSTKGKLGDGPTRDRHPLASIWPWRYLGIHSKNEDLTDYDDRINPRAGTRVGPRHQAVTVPWFGRPVEYAAAHEKGRRNNKNANKKETKAWKETLCNGDEERTGKAKTPWIQERPPGYQERGLDRPMDEKKEKPEKLDKKNQSAKETRCLFRLPEVGETSSRGEDPRDLQVPDKTPEQRKEAVAEYMKRAQEMVVQRRGKDKGPKERILEATNTEVLDEALNLFYTSNYDVDAALDRFRKFVDSSNTLALEGEELRKFEEGVTKYGSSLADITRHVKTRHFGQIVRFYYTWKKTKRGREIWENYEGRKAKKETKRADKSGLVDDVADDADDSAFDSNKAATKKRAFECKFCGTHESRAWRRAPLTATGQMVIDASGRGNKGTNIMVALCQRCALLWRKYAVHYESIDELGKRIAATGSKTLKRKPDEELFYELAHANMAAGVAMLPATITVAQSIGFTIPPRYLWQPEQETVRKKQKVGADKEQLASPLVAPPEPVKKKPIEKPAEPALVPDPPRPKVLPCAICNESGVEKAELFSCRHCRMTVHRNCFGIPAGRSAAKWSCDTCQNDSTNQNSTNYECVLCPTLQQPVELFEAPRNPQRKKTDREKEKERLEREMVANTTKEYLRKQEELGRPTKPRDALKATVGHKWMHVTCATWVPQIKFRDPSTFDQPEGLLGVPTARFTQECKLCKTSCGVCVTCHKCPATFHVSCAQQHGYPMGFDVTPVKGSRRDSVDSITLGVEKEAEKGSVEPVIFCKDHPPTKSILHPMHEAARDGLNALQLYVRHFKLADPALTGTVRKAALLNASRASTTAQGPRGSISNGTGMTAAAGQAHEPTTTVRSEEVNDEGDRVVHLKTETLPEPGTKQCSRCHCSTSAKWYPVKDPKRVQTDESHPRGLDYVCHRCFVGQPETQNFTPPPAAPPAPPPPPASLPASLPATVSFEPDTSVIHGQATQAGRWVPNGEVLAPREAYEHYPPPNGAPAPNGVLHHPPPHPRAPPPPPLHTVPPPPATSMVSPHNHHPPPRPSYYEDYHRRAPIPAPPPVNGHYPGPHGMPPAPPPHSPVYHNPHHSPHYSHPPPSASPTTSSYRLGHGPSGPLRFADDPFATIPAHSPPQPPHVHYHHSPHPHVQPPHSPLHNGRRSPPLPPLPPKASASTDANLRNLMN